MDCPKCEKPLNVVRVALHPPLKEAIMNSARGEIEVRQCRECTGVWFDIGRLESYLEWMGDRIVQKELPDDLHRKFSEMQADCPRCHARMRKEWTAKGHRAHVDRCRVCSGTWLDGGEVTRIRQHDSVSAALLGSL